MNQINGKLNSQRQTKNTRRRERGSFNLLGKCYFLGQVQFKRWQVKIEIYWSTGQLYYNFFFLPCDIKKFVEIWKERHAYAILGILAEVFGDIDDEELRDDDREDTSDEHEDDWTEFVNDEELMNIDWEEVSYNSIFPEDTSFLDESLDLDSSSDLCTIPEFVAGIIDNIQIE